MDSVDLERHVSVARLTRPRVSAPSWKRTISREGTTPSSSRGVFEEVVKRSRAVPDDVWDSSCIGDPNRHQCIRENEREDGSVAYLSHLVNHT